MAITLSRLRIYPFKSFDAVELDQARVLPSGALEHDRRFVVVRADGKRLTGKRDPRVHALRLRFDPAAGVVHLYPLGGPAAHFQVDAERAALDEWLCDYFRESVHVEEDTALGFPDDLDAPGPTVISRATLETVAVWFPGLETDEVRDRFRANLELAVPEPFWEDRLFGHRGDVVRFRIGSVIFAGTNPCQRCVVPTRASQSGTVWPDFQKTFARQRAATLPAWAVRERFDHFYRLAVNTRLEALGDGHLATGMPVEILDA